MQYVFQGKDEGRGVLLLELEAPEKQGCTHSAVRLHRRDGEYLALFAQES